jgi:hypothetical protein
MTARASALVLCLLGGLLVQACHAITASDEHRILAIIDFSHDGTHDVLAAPDTVDAGVDFPVTVTTFGGDCQPADTEVVLGGATATVSVYDYTRDVPCLLVMRRFPRATTVRFDDAGTGVLRIVGRRVGPETTWQGVTRVIEKEIVVR